MTVVLVACTIIGAVVLGVAALVSAAVVIGACGMVACMTATRGSRKVWPAGPFRASRGVWMARWPRFLRFAFRKHDEIAGEREHIAGIGLGGFLWADDCRGPHPSRVRAS